MQANQENFRAGEIRQQNADAENTISNGSSGITFSAYSARQRSNDPLLMALYDRNQAAQSLGNGELSMMPTSDGMRGVQMQDLLYRPQEGDGAEMTLAGAAAANRRGLFSNASNIAFRDKIASINDPTEIALQQFDRLRQAGVVSYTQYADVLKGADQSREAYGRAIWNSLNAQTAAAIGSADPMVRNSQINAEYFARFSENPNAYWMGLATVASGSGWAGPSLDQRASNCHRRHGPTGPAAPGVGHQPACRFKNGLRRPGRGQSARGLRHAANL